LSARHAAPAKGADQVDITVEDNGPGIPEAEREKIFSPFCSTKPHGMGLGLAIARRAVIDHNGQIDLQSDDQGTRVRVGLPAARNGSRP
jgi:two-component system C4-dicarboxylate transport sensor histidine kinase DctB